MNTSLAGATVNRNPPFTGEHCGLKVCLFLHILVKQELVKRLCPLFLREVEIKQVPDRDAVNLFPSLTCLI